MKNEKEAPVAVDATPKTPKFSKESLLKCKRWSKRRDALSFLLKDDAEYSHADVENILNDYMKGQVK